jgi:glycosyltransferase involved in cell wall biosynthesis
MDATYKMSSPVISIVIPTYNHAKFLRTALDSIIVQSIPDWEVIVVNNYSQDDTVSLVNSYKDPRIKLVNFSNNGIISASRNYGISITKAPLVAFLDSDDLWYPNKLSSCINKLAQGYDFVCHAEVWVGPGARRREVFYGPAERATYRSLLLEGNCISTSAVVVKREWIESVGGFSIQPEFVTAEDYELWLKLAKAGARIGFVGEILGEYLIHDGNQSRIALRNMDAEMEVFLSHKNRFLENISRQAINRRASLIYYGGARGLQNSGKHWQAWPLFFKAVVTYPWVLKFYAAMYLNFLRRRP